jgi:hypothetical protein
VSAALGALRAGAAALLAAQGEERLAAIVTAARVELAGPGETWSMGSREVSAHRVALVVPAAAFVVLSGEAGRLARVRDAFAQAMRSPETELAELHVELLLPVVEQPWARAYREAPARDMPAERPSPEAVLEGAAALLAAMGEVEAGEMVRRGELEAAQVQGAATPLTQWLVRLAPEGRARTLRDAGLGEKIRQAVHDAARRAGEAVSVELGVAGETARRPSPSPLC